MCGIVGVFHIDRKPVDPKTVRAMADSLVHRGPDGWGVELPEPWVGLGHRRLSIIDLETGKQPLCNEDGTVWITYNGEIFNYRELRDELIGKGHTFKTQSDTEVIVHLYEEEGPACVERLNGQFAFAIWDGETFFLARDPIGIKPLYVYLDSKRFLFASEPRALLTLPDFNPEPNLDALHLYFRYRYVPSPMSALEGVRTLRPGEWMTVDREGRETRHRYWDLDPARVESLTDVDSARDALRASLEAAVRSQLVSDVPIGAFLSGGLDSSTTTALMALASDEPINTFCMGFNEERFDERRYAREVAERYQTQHHEGVLAAKNAPEVMLDMLQHFDEPFGDTSVVPTSAVCKLARGHVKVTLSGDGGDELFGGYARAYKALHHLAIPPALRPLFPLIKRMGKPPRDPARWVYPDTPRVDAQYLTSLVRISNRELRTFYGPRLRERLGRGGEDPIADLFTRVRKLPPFSRMLAIDLHGMLSEYHLVKTDRVSMRHSLEVRVPFLDRRFVELAFALSPALKLYGNRSKGLLREAVKDVLPASVLSRGKKGFSVPFRDWFVGSLSTFAQDTLADSLVVSEGLVSQRAVNSLLYPLRGKTIGSRLWRVLVLESWLRGLRDGRFKTPSPAASAT